MARSAALKPHNAALASASPAHIQNGVRDSPEYFPQPTAGFFSIQRCVSPPLGRCRCSSAPTAALQQRDLDSLSNLAAVLPAIDHSGGVDLSVRGWLKLSGAMKSATEKEETGWTVVGLKMSLAAVLMLGMLEHSKNAEMKCRLWSC